MFTHLNENGGNCMKLIAFDQSTTATGWALTDQKTGELLEYGVIKPKPSDPTNDRIRYTIKRCMYLCDHHQVTFVFIEGIQIQHNPRVYEILAKLQGTLEICLEERNYFVNVVKASEWRKKVGIKSKKRAELKAEAIQMVKELYDLDVSEDEAEAVLFARAFAMEQE